jgi:hypothetical protein
MAAEPVLPPAADGEEDVPPPLGTWRRLYALVLGVLAVEVGLLWLLGRTFR